MSKLTVSNLNDDVTLDAAAGAIVRGGFVPGIAALLARYSTTTVTQNAVTLNLVSGNQGANVVDSINVMPVTAGSGMTVLAGSGPF